MTRKFTYLFSCFAALFSVAVRSQTEDAAPRKNIAAPPLVECVTEPVQELGLWDDAFAPADDDVMFLRRGDSLFLLPMDRPDPPILLRNDPSLADSRMMYAGRSGDRTWLFLVSKRSGPIAIDPFGGQKEFFEISGLKVPGTQAPVIEWCMAMPNVDAAVMMIAGGDNETWPRDGNRPVYFWMQLSSGRIRCLPIGWDLDYISSGLSRAVFRTEKIGADRGRIRETVDLRSGEAGAPAPDSKTDLLYHYNGSYRDKVRALYGKRADTGDASYFTGLASGGAVYPFVMPYDKVRYLSAAKILDGFVGFGLRASGTWESEGFFISELRAGATPKRVADGLIVGAFEMLIGGNCILETGGHGHLSQSSEPCFLCRDGSYTWNLLDGVERLPNLPDAVKDDARVTDAMTVKLLRGGGRGNGKDLLLVICSQYRADMRQVLVSPGMIGKAPKVPGLEDTLWGRTLLVDDEGRRGVTDLFRNAQIPTNLWMHRSGRVVMTKNTGAGYPAPGERRVELRSAMVRFEK